MDLWLTRLHLELGLTAAPFDLDMIRTAIKTEIKEFVDLDWKKVLPGKSEPELEEFAKDVAAMANTVGGILIYGVAETRGKGTAAEMAPVSLSEGDQRRLRALAASRIHPFVQGVQIVTLPVSAGADEGVLIINVPQSADAPHAIGTEKLGIPVRHDSDTRWLTEREIASAYRDRFDREVSGNRRINELLIGAGEDVGGSTSSWLVAAVTPRIARRSLTRPTKTDITTKFGLALKIFHELPARNGAQWFQFLEQLEQAMYNPRRGLKRWALGTPRDGVNPQSVFAHVDFHDDGAVTCAVNIDQWLGEGDDESHIVSVEFLESFVAATAALASSASTHGSQVALAQVVKEPVKKTAIVGQRRLGTISLGDMREIPGARRLDQIHTIYGEMTSGMDTDELLMSTALLSRDLVNQFGVDSSVLVPNPFE